MQPKPTIKEQRDRLAELDKEIAEIKAELALIEEPKKTPVKTPVKTPIDPKDKITLKLCYCCKTQQALPSGADWGVPICPCCNKGLVMVMPIKTKKSVAVVDQYRDKMFQNVDRIQSAYDKMCMSWRDPRKPESTFEVQQREELRDLE